MRTTQEPASAQSSGVWVSARPRSAATEPKSAQIERPSTAPPDPSVQNGQRGRHAPRGNSSESQRLQPCPPRHSFWLKTAAYTAEQLVLVGVMDMKRQRPGQEGQGVETQLFSMVSALSYAGCLGLYIAQGKLGDAEIRGFLHDHVLPLMERWPKRRSVLVMYDGQAGVERLDMALYAKGCKRVPLSREVDAPQSPLTLSFAAFAQRLEEHGGNLQTLPNPIDELFVAYVTLASPPVAAGWYRQAGIVAGGPTDSQRDLQEWMAVLHHLEEKLASSAQQPPPLVILDAAASERAGKSPRETG